VYSLGFYTHTNPVCARAYVSPAALPSPLVLSMAPLSARIASPMSDLAAKACVPCRGGVPPLKGEELASLQKQVDGWNVIDGHHITKAFKFPNFREALQFVNRVGDLAEEQGHHPDIFLAWGKVEITIWTHKINGLTESDFILAAKIDQIHES
jgi:4a-hydroxytetrahydrobiopterin dehydratase